MMRAVIAGLVLVLASCESGPPTSRDLDQISRDYQRQQAADQSSSRPPARAPDDTCGLAEHADLIGVSEADLHPPANARVICMGCMATMDFNLTRLTIQMGPDHKVASMRCG